MSTEICVVVVVVFVFVVFISFVFFSVIVNIMNAIIIFITIVDDLASYLHIKFFKCRLK